MFLLFLFGTQSLKGEWQSRLRRSLPIEAESTSQKGAVSYLVSFSYALWGSSIYFELRTMYKEALILCFYCIFLAHPVQNHSWWPCMGVCDWLIMREMAVSIVLNKACSSSISRKASFCETFLPCSLESDFVRAFRMSKRGKGQFSDVIYGTIVLF